MNMPGNNLGEAVDDTDEGLIDVGPSPAHSVQQGAVGGTLYASFDGIAFHFPPSLADFFVYKKGRPVGTAPNYCETRPTGRITYA
jgi:hypothetical protein